MEVLTFFESFCGASAKCFQCPDTQLTDTDNYEFQVCLSTGGKDFFNYAFVIDSTGRIQETRSRGKNLCTEQSNNASSN